MHMPTESQYQQAIVKVIARAPASYRRMLEANFGAKEHTVSPHQLALAAGFKHLSAVNLHYGRLAALVGEELRYRPKKLSLQHQTCWTFVLADWSASKRAWVLLPEVVAALENLGWSAG